MSIPTQRTPVARDPGAHEPASSGAGGRGSGGSGGSAGRGGADVEGRRLLPARLLARPPVVLALGGAIVGAVAADDVRQRLLADLRARDALVVLDTSEVTAIDDVGMWAVVAAGAVLELAGHRLWLWAPSPAVLSALARTGLDEDLLPLEPPAGPVAPTSSSAQLGLLEAGALFAVVGSDEAEAERLIGAMPRWQRDELAEALAHWARVARGGGGRGPA